MQALPGYSWTPTPNVTGYSGINNGVFNDFTTRVTYNPTTFGDIRNPYVNNSILGARKNFAIREGMHLQLGMDVFNALNHPQFGSINVTPTSSFFGAISGNVPAKWVQVNSPRTIQLRGRFTF